MNTAEIVLNKVSYLSGDDVKFKLNVSMQNSQMIQTVCVAFIGYEKSDTSEKRNMFLSHYIEYQVPDRFSTTVSSSRSPTKSKRDFSKWIGSHTFKFTSKLPAMCPSSFNSKVVLIDYRVKVKIVLVDEKGGSNQIFAEIPVKVEGSLYDLATIQNYSVSQRLIRKCTWMLVTGHVAVQMRINKKIYMAGENIDFDLVIVNNTRMKFKKNMLMMLQNLEHSTSKGEEHQVMCIQLDSIGPGQSVLQNKLSMKIPSTLSETLESKKIQCGSIGHYVTITYRIKLRLESRQLIVARMSIPIIIMRPTTQSKHSSLVESVLLPMPSLTEERQEFSQYTSNDPFGLDSFFTLGASSTFREAPSAPTDLYDFLDLKNSIDIQFQPQE